MKIYTEEQLMEALRYQKWTDYQIAGDLLITFANDNKILGQSMITATLDYLASDNVVSIEEVDNYLDK